MTKLNDELLKQANGGFPGPGEHILKDKGRKDGRGPLA